MTDTCVADTDTIALTLSSGTLTADAILDPDPTNQLTESASGLYVAPQEPTAWFGVSDGWAYASADAPTYTATADTDLTATYKVGQRFRATQTTERYFIITAVSYNAGTDKTTLTLYGGTDYTLSNAAISAAYYSTGKWPTGFPADPSKWTVTATDTGDRTQANAAVNTWYQPGTIQIDVPIGGWYLGYTAALGVTSAAKTLQATLSTNAAAVTDADLTTGFLCGESLEALVGRRKVAIVTPKATYKLICRHTTAAATPTIGFYGSSICETVLLAVCAYL